MKPILGNIVTAFRSVQLLPESVRRSVVHIGLIILVIAIFTFVLTSHITRQIYTREENELSCQVALLVSSMSSYHTSLADSAERLSAVFVKNFSEPFTVTPTQTVMTGSVETPRLLCGTTVMNNNNSLTDSFTTVTNAIATIFVRKGDDFIRVATSLMKEDGTRAIGTKLEHAHPAYQALLRGESFTGKVRLFSKDYMTKYVPVRDRSGKVVAVLFIGLDFTDSLLVLKKQIRDTRIFTSGYFYAFDVTDGTDRGLIQVHPHLEYANVLGVKDANGRDFVKEMLENKNGTVRYYWINREAGETEPREKLVVYRYLKDWNWIVAGGVPLDELRGNGREIVKAMVVVMSLVAIIVILLSVSMVQRERKLTAAREESDRRYRELFREMRNGLALHEIIYDSGGIPHDYRFLAVNPAFETMTGLKGTDVVGRTVREILPSLEPEWFEHVGQVAVSGTPVHIEHYSADLKRYLEVDAYSSQQGRLATIFQDVTQRRLAEEALKEKNAEFEHFTYTVSHDMKSPLVTIKTFIGYLEQDLANEDRQRILQDVSFIRSAADKMEKQLYELLELSRVGRVVNSLTASSYQELVDEAIASVAGGLTKRGVVVNRGTERIVLYGDRARLSELWQNLVDNAVKYLGSQQAPRIDIGVEIRNGERVFYVRDNGIGIEPALAERVFEMFEKIDPESDGSGLGLALVRRIVEVHGGRIWVESLGAGCGSTFCFTFGEHIYREKDASVSQPTHDREAAPEESVPPTLQSGGLLSP